MVARCRVMLPSPGGPSTAVAAEESGLTFAEHFWGKAPLSGIAMTLCYNSHPISTSGKFMHSDVPASLDSGPTLNREGGRSARSLAFDFLALTKPRIISLLLVTSLGAMYLAAEGSPRLSTILLVFLGGSLGAGGANALNHYLDRDIDERMGRTQLRPLPGHRLEPWHAAAFGIVLNVIAFAVLATWVNVLSAVLTVSATLFYVLVYTIWLKRTTPQNIVIGGAAGAVPPLVGWAAVTGTLELQALYLFAIVFFWTPPHFWALSLLIKNDYAKAGVPMLPVVAGTRHTAISIGLHSVILVMISILFFTVDGLGWLYLSGALGLGLLFLAGAARLLLSGSTRDALYLYLYSLLYLTLLFVFVIMDSVL